MSNGKVGLTFREMMSGGFALGETDPAQGERKGKQAGPHFACITRSSSRI